MSKFEMPINVQFDVEYEKLANFAQSWHSDPEVRARAESDPRGVLNDAGIPTPPHSDDIRIVANTEDTLYFPLPPDPNTELSDDRLAELSGGGVAFGSASSASSIPSTISSVGTFSSL